MNRSTDIKQVFSPASAVSIVLAVCCFATTAHGEGVRFQRPREVSAPSQQVQSQFRRPGLQTERDSQAEKKTVTRVAKQKVIKQTKPALREPAFFSQQSIKQAKQVELAAKPLKKPTSSQPSIEKPVTQVQRVSRTVVASDVPVVYEPVMEKALVVSSYGCDLCDGPCTCEAACGCPEPSCGIYEPGCGICEPSCGCGEPSCGICEPGCGIGEASCGCGEVDCGTCCARPGPDYWCFPICLPRFKDLSVFAGVQGFRGPRDFSNGRSDSNFGFNQGINISGRAPLVSLLFPQLSYQLGYRAVQSRLHGTATATDDRSQQFVTAGLFRRVNTGVQAGIAWDLLSDDLDENIDIHQIRYEISLKSPRGREFGFFGTSSTNDAVVGGLTFEAIDQFAVFARWNFGNGYETRIWGGASGDGDGLFGGEFYAPLSSRWALQSGFNYLIPDEQDGLPGVSEESWNVGINLVWHLGRTAKRGARSPYRPLFSVADNGWFFVDQVP